MPISLKRLDIALIAWLAVFLVLGVWASWSWRFQHDSPILLYVAYLMDQGRVPYVEIFDMNLPGTYLAYYGLMKIFGLSDAGMRAADLALLAGTLALTWLWLRPIGIRVAACGALTWGVMYLGFGPADTLQRECLMLVPILCGVLIFLKQEVSVPRRYFGAGVAFGVVVTMKPQAAIGFPLLVLMDWAASRSSGGTLREDWRTWRAAWAAGAAGLAIPIVFAVLFMWRSGALAPMAEMMANYWPLYGRLGDDHQTLSGGDRVGYMIRQYRSLGGYEIWLGPAALGAFMALHATPLDPRQRLHVRALLVLTFAYSLYPLFSGQFWRYHWFLLAFFLAQTSALCLIRQPAATGRARLLFAPSVLAFVLVMMTPLGLAREGLIGGRPEPIKDGRVDAIASFLRREMRPGETVQPLDWTAGAVHAMLIARAPIATRHVYDFHFYHHVSRPYIQELRRRFITDLTDARPRFLIEMTTDDKPWVSGRDTTRRFEALEALIRGDYTVAVEGKGFRIHERRPGA
jgi:hypothetical protein